MDLAIGKDGHILCTKKYRRNKSIHAVSSFEGVESSAMLSFSWYSFSITVWIISRFFRTSFVCEQENLEERSYTQTQTDVTGGEKRRR